MTSRDGKPPPATANKWAVAATVVFGAFMSVMDINVVNVAMPHMMGTFGRSISAITWVATSYSIAEIIMVTMTGWLSTLLGRKRLYLLSYGLFTIGSILCGIATSFPQMLLFRAIQGLGGGTLIPVSQAILRETFPKKQQGLAMGLFGMGVVLAPALGPVLGGWLTDNYGWPWIFLINVPVSIVGMLMVITFVHDPPYLRRGVKRIDWLGIVLLGITLTTMQIVLERGQSVNWFDSSLIIIGTAISLVSVGALLIWELKIKEPVINFRVLSNTPLAVGSLIGLVSGVALYGSAFLLPQLTQDLLGYPAFEAGLVLMPRALALIIFMPLIGWLYPYINSRALIITGILALFSSYYALSHMSLAAGFWNLAPMLFFMGIGMPMVFVTTSTVSLSTIAREDMTDATSVFTLSRRVGGNIGYALVATLVARGQQIHRADMIGNISPLNPNYLEYQQHAASLLSQAGVKIGVARQHIIHSMINGLVNRQAAMMAYNDTSLLLGFLFLLSIPLVFLLPRRDRSRGKT